MRSNIRKTIQLVLSWILLIFAVLMGILSAVLGFLGAAFFINSTTVISAAAMLVCLVFSTGLARITGGKIVPLHRGSFAWNKKVPGKNISVRTGQYSVRMGKGDICQSKKFPINSFDFGMDLYYDFLFAMLYKPVNRRCYRSGQ